jgi:hypothetical protein
MADVVIGVLREHGFSDREGIEIFSILASYTVGFTLSQQHRGSPEETPVDRLGYLKSLTEYPNLAAVAELYLTWPRSRAFEHGLEHLIRAYSK